MLPSDFPIPLETELALHQRLMDGDPTASADLAQAFYPSLIQWLIEHNRSSIPEDWCADAATDAWQALVKNPHSFKREKGIRLGAYLRMSAQGDLLNRLRSETRHRGKRLEAVQVSAQDRKYIETDDDPSLPIRIREEMEQVHQEIIPVVSDGLSDSEQRVLALMLQGERKTAAYAQALGIEHWPKQKQTEEVQRVKNKIKKRIARRRTDDGQPS